MRGLCRMKACATRESGNTPDTAGVRLVLQPEPILLLSLLFIALGVDLVAMTDLGVSPMLAPAFVVNQISPLSYGTCSIILQTCMLASVCIVARKLRPECIVAFGLNALFGLFLDFWLAILPTIPESLTVRIAVWIAAVILLVITVALAMLTRLPMTPCDSFARDMAELLNKDYRKFRTGYDLCSTAVSAGISFLFTGGLIGIGVGTVVYALTLGNGVSFMCKKLSPHVTFKPTYIKRLAECHSKKQ